VSGSRRSACSVAAHLSPGTLYAFVPCVNRALISLAFVPTLLSLGCGGSEPLAGPGTGGSGAGSGGATGSTTGSLLAGIWSGKVSIDHPGFYGPPIDEMTVQIADDGRLAYCGFGVFGYQASFGAPPDLIPLSGSAIAHVFKGDGFFLRFTVLAADWQADHVSFSYKEHSDGLGIGETPETPYTDLTTSLVGSLMDGKLHVHWTAQGSEYTAPLQAVADGDLARQ
jgi:hypothetical protein